MRTPRMNPPKEVMVLKAKVLPHLTCPICNDIFQDATTISECLHTFCKRCITKKLIKDDICPICKVPLGCTPLEKLRMDHQLSEVKKILLSTKKQLKTSNVQPAKRKQKFLSSLIPPHHPPVVPQQINRFSFRKQTISSNGFHKALVKDARPVRKTLDKKGGMQCKKFRAISTPIECLNSGAMPSSCDRKLSGLYESPKKVACMKHSKFRLDEPSPSDAVLDLCHHPSLPRKRLHRKNHRVAAQRYKDFSHIVEECSVEACTDVSSSEDFRGGDSRARCLKRLAPLVNSRCTDTLGKVLPSSAVKGERRKISKMLERLPLQLPVKRSSFEVLNRIKNREKILKLESAIGDLSTSCGISSMADDDNHKNLAKCIPDRKGNGLWFRLRAAKNQDMDGALPQISTQYVRIWDGSQPVSAIRKYLAMKFSLKSEKEVEITCQGQPVVPGLPLESVKNIWLATAVDRSVQGKEASDADSCSTGSGAACEDCLEDELLVVLTYGRNRGMSTNLIIDTSDPLVGLL